MDKMMWVIFAVLIVPALLVCYVNAVIFVKYELAKKKGPSYIVFLGAILGFLALRACPVPEVSRFAWIFFILDAGTSLPVVHLVLLLLGRPRKY